MEASAVPREAPGGVSGFVPPHVLRLASDARLVALIREGRPAAFEIAYSRHHRGILSFCRHMLGDAQEAEDAVQQTFLAAYNDLISSTKPIHLRAWLYTIARNRCYSILRARREQPTADLAEHATDGLATQVQARQDLRDLVRDMRRLPKDQRAALVLAEIDALNHEQIGEVLGVPREKVKALVFQARESLLASRAARETDCAEIREQLATMRGAGLRRTNLRRHLHECPGCREFRKQVERQRRRLALIIPVAPTLALKEGVLAGTIGGSAGILGGGIVAGGGGLLASSLLKSSATKTVMGLMLAGVGTAGTLVAARDLHHQLSLGGAPGHRLGPNPPSQLSSASAATHAVAGRFAGGPTPVVRVVTTRSWGSAGSVGGGTGKALPLLDPFAPLSQSGVVISVSGPQVPKAVAGPGGGSPPVPGASGPGPGAGQGAGAGAQPYPGYGSGSQPGGGSQRAGGPSTPSIRPGSSSPSSSSNSGGPSSSSSTQPGAGSQGGGSGSSHGSGYGGAGYGGGSGSSGTSSHVGGGDGGYGAGSAGTSGSSGGGTRAAGAGSGYGGGSGGGAGYGGGSGTGSGGGGRGASYGGSGGGSGGGGR